MKYTLVPFEEVILAVKDHTGIENLRPKYESIKRMIADAEVKINPYSGFLTKKLVKYHKGSAYFDGKNVKKLSDFIELDKIGCCKHGLCPNTYIETPTHIIICDGEKRESVIMSYYSITCDGSGNPVTTMNHKEAVVDYIVSKLMAQKVFMREAYVNTQQYYDNKFLESAAAASGNDFFPSLEESNIATAIFKMTDSQVTTANLSGVNLLECACDALDLELKPIDNGDDDNDFNVYWGQKPNNLSFENEDVFIENAISIANGESTMINFDSYKTEFSIIKDGYPFSYSLVGPFFFIFEDVDDDSIDIIDILGLSIINNMVKYYNSSTRTLLYVSKEFVTPSVIFLKFEHNE